MCVCVCVCAHAQSHPTLYNPMDCFSIPGIFQARILEWIAMPSSRESFLGIEPKSLASPALADEFFTTSATWEALYRGFVGGYLSVFQTDI